MSTTDTDLTFQIAGINGIENYSAVEVLSDALEGRSHKSELVVVVI